MSRSRDDTVLELKRLSVEYSSQEGAVAAVRDVTLSINRGETLGLVGESGSGKSTLALAIMQYLGEDGRIVNGDIQLGGKSVRDVDRATLRNIRGNRIAHVPQSPTTALNPSVDIGEQISETVMLHQGLDRDEALQQTYRVLAEVNIPNPEQNAQRYPHELSGGQKQRVLLAMALVCNPEVMILDEPTTGLDATTEAKILSLIESLKQEYETSILLITHDLGVVARVADTAAVMYAGELMEIAPVNRLFRKPTHPYTQGLLRAVPDIRTEREPKPIPGETIDLTAVPEGCAFADRCEYVEPACRSGEIPTDSIPGEQSHRTKCIRWRETANVTSHAATASAHEETDNTQEKQMHFEPLLELESVRKYFDEPSFFDRVLGSPDPVKAVDDVSLQIKPGETVGLVGESGCGKSTLARAVVGLSKLTGGTVRFQGRPISKMSSTEYQQYNSEVQIVFQHPDSSLNPSKTIGASVERPLKLFSDLSSEQRTNQVVKMLERVELGAEYADRKPNALSGGEKQRAAIARAFISNPSVVILDEPLSALDVSVQARILDLLDELRDEFESSYLFISHDLSVVNHISDRIAVMYLGSIIETGSRREVFQPPYHPYTESLLSAIPEPDPTANRERIHLNGDVPSARNKPDGCAFHTRCPKKIGVICENEVPEQEPVETERSKHRIACHLDEDEMTSDVVNFPDRDGSNCDVKSRSGDQSEINKIADGEGEMP